MLEPVEERRPGLSGPGSSRPFLFSLSRTFPLLAMHSSIQGNPSNSATRRARTSASDLYSFGISLSVSIDVSTSCARHPQSSYIRLVGRYILFDSAESVFPSAHVPEDSASVFLPAIPSRTWPNSRFLFQEQKLYSATYFAAPNLFNTVSSSGQYTIT